MSDLHSAIERLLTLAGISIEPGWIIEDQSLPRKLNEVADRMQELYNGNIVPKSEFDKRVELITELRKHRDALLNHLSLLSEKDKLIKGKDEAIQNLLTLCSNVDIREFADDAFDIMAKAQSALSPEIASEWVSKGWQHALLDACAVAHVGSANDTPRQLIEKLIQWNITVALDPRVSQEAAEIYNRAEKAEAELSQLQKQCAEMREALIPAPCSCFTNSGVRSTCKRCQALSTSAGQDWVRRDLVKQAYFEAINYGVEYRLDDDHIETVWLRSMAFKSLPTPPTNKGEV